MPEKVYMNIYDEATLKDFRGKQKCFRNKDDTKMRSTFIKNTTRLFVFFVKVHNIITYVTAGIKKTGKKYEGGRVFWRLNFKISPGV